MFTQQEEAIPESVKNILLVMADSGYLTPPPFKDSNEEKIWTETKKRLDRFLPSLFDELFPISGKTDEGSSEKPTPNGNELSEKEHSEENQQLASQSPASVE